MNRASLAICFTDFACNFLPHHVHQGGSWGLAQLPNKGVFRSCCGLDIFGEKSRDDGNYRRGAAQKSPVTLVPACQKILAETGVAQGFEYQLQIRRDLAF